MWSNAKTVYLNVTYNGTHIPGSISYISIFSSDDVKVAPYNTSRLEGAINIVVSGLSYDDLLISSISFELVKEAIEDRYVTTTTSTTTTSTIINTTDTDNSTVETTTWFLSTSLVAILFIIKKKKAK